jgi:hypothetical protein
VNEKSHHTNGKAPFWAHHNISFWQRDSLEVLKSMVGDVRLAKDMKWAPESTMSVFILNYGLLTGGGKHK